MAGMHRDKCGAAFVAGFFQVPLLCKSFVCLFLSLWYYIIIHHHIHFNWHFQGKSS